MPPGVASLLRRRKKKKHPPSSLNQKPQPKGKGKGKGKGKDGDGSSSTWSDSDSDEYSDSQEERKDEYRKGGYHPVIVGELYNKRYRIAHKLGWGYFSTVWLCWDYVDRDFKALKVQKSAEHYREAAFDEVKLLAQIMRGDPKGEKCCAAMTDHFEHRGPNGVHVCMVFRVLGENLLSIIKSYNYKGIPLPIVRAQAKRILIGLDYLHRELKIIHTDIKPENVLLATPTKEVRDVQAAYKVPPIDKQLTLKEKDPATLSKAQKKRLKKMLKKQNTGAVQGGDDGDDGSQAGDSPTAEAAAHPATGPEGSPRHATGAESEAQGADTAAGEQAEAERRKAAVLADFGNGCWTHKQFTDDIQTRQYRAPEVILGEGYSTPCDMWSCACLIFELLTGEFLFDPRSSRDYDRDEDHLALMIELLGPLPPSMAKGRGKYRDRHINRRGTLRHIHNLKYWGLSAVLHVKYKFTKEKADEIAAFLTPMLAADPAQRATAQEMLEDFPDWFEPHSDDASCFVHQQDRSDSEETSGTESRSSQSGTSERASQSGSEGSSEEDEEDEDDEEESAGGSSQKGKWAQPASATRQAGGGGKPEGGKRSHSN
eukprot:TRINITY_DN768_c1_g2_i1.p1 TRINITY_DN768_c1_g2~~TRINITY_DN768_c1_g2_i1.p1  ORF type:complete len:623 (+),score=249.38 TRINITY_DN768_c1_g2_i1:79-1869(+)